MHRRRGRPGAGIKTRIGNHQAVLALLALGLHEGHRTWMAFDWEVLGRLHEQGYISEPVGRAKSVLLTEEDARESERLLRLLFSRSPD